MAKILITGGAGFIGSHLIDYILKATKHELIVLDRLNSEYAVKRYMDIDLESKRVHCHIYDLKDPFNEELSEELKDVNIVIHLAASSHVDTSIKDPMLFTIDNIVGTCNLLNWAKDIDNLKFIYVSTDEVFGSALNTIYAFKETDTLSPENPYSATKASAEMLVRAYACTYKLEAMIVRFTNIIGIRQHPEKFIPKVISKVLKDEQILIHTDSTLNKDGSRYYLDVQDAVGGLMILIKHFNKYPIITKENRFEGIYHFSGNKEIINSDIVGYIANLMKKTPDIKRVSYSEDRPYHDLSYRLNDTRIRLLGWEPQWDIVRSLEYIVPWTLEHPEWLEIIGNAVLPDKTLSRSNLRLRITS